MSQIAKHEPSELSTIPNTPMSILASAVQSGQPAETLMKLVELSERMAAAEAKQSFAAAMAQFAATCPPVQRRTRSDQFQCVRRDGTKGPRMYASLEDIARDVRGPAAAVGLSFRWTDMTVEEGRMTISCIVSHEAGHSESSSVTLPVFIDVGKAASECQKAGIVQTYAMRYSLIQALGLTTCDEDMDGDTSQAGGDKISESDLLALEVALDDAKADVAKFKQWAGVDRLADIPASKVAGAFAAVARRKAASK